MFKRFIQSLIKSLGLKRQLSAAFATLALIITQIPSLAPFAGVLTAIAGWLGVAGVAHAGAVDRPGAPAPALLTSQAPQTANLSLPTIAAFLNALVLAADQVAQLTPYKALFVFLAAIFSVFSTATTAVKLVSK